MPKTVVHHRIGCVANPEHLAILEKGVEGWNEWRARQELRPDLTGANLQAASLQGIDFSRCWLARANLTRVEFTSAKLSDADLTGAVLMGADLRMASLENAILQGARCVATDFSGCYLTNADLESADLSGAYFRGARLRGARFTGARLRGTTFAEVDLRQARDLDQVRHDGPSSIGVDTIYLSRGEVAEIFFRGAGVPDTFITYVRSLTRAALEFYSCFISYSSDDQPFADRLYADLQARGVRCWFAPHDIQGGRKIHEQIDEAIRVYDKLLLILSESSMDSKWVNTEIANARAREQQQNRQMLFPIAVVSYDRIRAWKLFDADSGVDSAREVREYFIPDFSNWKDHDAYSQALERLVRDLKTGRKE